MRLEHRLAFYAMSGISTEVFFTALKALWYEKDLRLQGHTQLWVAFIYAFGGLLFEQIHLLVQARSSRVFIYLGLVYLLEYNSGWLLQKMLGSCPWEYQEVGHIHGFIQLRYIPAWLIFVLLADNGIQYANRLKLK